MSTTNVAISNHDVPSFENIITHSTPDLITQPGAVSDMYAKVNKSRLKNDAPREEDQISLAENDMYVHCDQSHRSEVRHREEDQISLAENEMYGVISELTHSPTKGAPTNDEDQISLAENDMYGNL